MTDLATLVRVLEEGGVVACPTETWLGLLADARNEKAVERVAELKGRPSDMPIALLLPDASSVATVAEPPSAAARALIADHWPGRWLRPRSCWIHSVLSRDCAIPRS